MVLYRPGSARLHVLNATARALWEELSAGASLRKAAAKIASTFNAPLVQVERDCRRMAAEFRKNLRAPPGAAPAPATVPTRPPATLRCPRAARRWHGRIATRDFTIRCTPEILTQIEPVIGHLRAPAKAARPIRLEAVFNAGEFVLNAESREVGRKKTAGGLQYLLAGLLADMACSKPGWLALLHAGAVLCKGKCLVFPASGGSGKTTLVAGLMHAGHTLLSDDILIVEESSRKVRALPLPLSIKQGSWPVLAPRYPELLRNLVIVAGGKHLRFLGPRRPRKGVWDRAHAPACLINPLYRAGAKAELIPCSALEMLHILFSTRSLICTPDPVRVRKMIEWICALPTYRLVYGELDEAVKLLNRLEPL